MKKAFNTKVDAIGLSIFRMLYSIILFCEIHQLYTFRSIIYDKESFLYKGELDVTFLFVFWFAIVICLFLGLFTRYISILNYIFSVIIFSSASHFEYHVFYAYVGINFLLMFIPISRVLSLDSLMTKVKYTSIGRPFVVNRKVLKINYIALVFVAIGLVYFDSVFHKFSNHLWQKGFGVWLPSSLPMVTWNDTSVLLNQKELMLFLGYLVLAFETVFIFLFWKKKWRIPLMLLGIFFHFGILIAYPIPWFALTFIAVYFLMMPIGFWLKIAQFFKAKRASYTFYYDAECPLCNKVVVIIKHFDVFKTINCATVQGNFQNETALKSYSEEELLINIHGVTNSGKVKVGFWAYVQLLKEMKYTYPLGLLISLPIISNLGQWVYRFVAGNRLTERCTAENCSMPVYTKAVEETDDLLIKGFNQLSITKFFWKFVLIFLLVGQLMYIWFSPFIQNNFPKVGYFNKVVKVPFSVTKDFYKDYFGLTHHDVFIDKHFLNFNHIVKVTFVSDKGKIVNLPLINENGMPSGYNQGVIWRNLSFNVISQKIQQDKIEKGIIPYLIYFMKEENLKINKFKFFIKEVATPKNWEKDYLKKQMAHPWIEVGEVNYDGEVFEFSWNGEMNKIINSESK
ncbi:MAG: DUF393 domain-containing protein [Flavobacteriales bacterium]|nr:DUF393 domain-containing protein [Flavobacteriales bacterium]